MTTIFRPHTIAAIMTYCVTNLLINNTTHGWEGVFAGAIASGLVAALTIKGGE